MGVERCMTHSVLPGFIEMLEASKIRHPKNMLRERIDNIEELAASIDAHGLLEPIVVRPVTKGFQIVAGSRRFEACKRLRFRKIPSQVVELSEKEAFEVGLTENLQRMTLDPIEEGQAFKKYVEGYGYGGISELSRKIGKSPSYVSRRIGLLSLPDEVREEIVRRRKSPNLANELLPLDERTRERMFEFISIGTIADRDELRERIKLHNKTRQREFEVPSPFLGAQSDTERRSRAVDRGISKCIGSLKENINRFGEVIESLDESDRTSWVVRESLTWQVQSMNKQIDELLTLRKKIKSP